MHIHFFANSIFCKLVKKLNLLLNFSRFIFSRCVSIYLVISIHWFHYIIISLYHMSGLIKPYRLLDFHIVTKGEFLLKCIFFFRSLSYHIFLQLNGLSEFCKYRLRCSFEFVTYFQSFVSIKNDNIKLSTVSKIHISK